MKRYNTQSVEMPMANTKRHLGNGILAMLVLIFLGCATAPPKPITIQHQNAPFQVGTAVSGIQNQKDAADGAARFVKQSEIPAAQEKVTATSSKTNDKKQSEKIPASLGEEPPKSIPNQVKKEEQNNIPQEAVKNEKMNVVSADEAARFVKQSEIPAAQEKVTATSSKTDDKKQSENIPEGVSEESPKSIPDQVKNDELKDVSPEAVKNEKMIAEKIAPDPSVEMKKESAPSGIIVVGNSDTKRYHLPGMPNYNKVLKYHRVLFESEQQAIESGYYKAGTKKGVGTPKQVKKEQIKKPNTAMEMKKEISGPVKNDEQKDVSPEAEKNDNEQKEKISASVSEEIKKDLPEPVKNEEQKSVSPETAKSDKEQSENIPANETQEVKTAPAAPVEDGAQKEIPRGVTSRIDDAQVDEIMDGVKEELKSDIHEQVYNQVSEILRTEKSDLPEWIKSIRFAGDVRLRYEGDRFNPNNADLAQPAAPTQLMNTKTNHDYFRYRVRAGAEVPVNEDVDAIIRLATGNDTNPISTNSTMGDYMNRDRAYFDLAYIKWHPWKFLVFEGGRIPKPWFSSDLVWSPNLNFEGFALNINKPVVETLIPFLTVGAFPLQQYDFSSSGKWLTAGQLGLERKREKGISWKIGAAYYYFSNITGESNDPLNPGMTDWTAPLYQQKGNTLFDIGTGGVQKLALASEFQELNFTGNLDIGFWDPVHIIFLGDFVTNIGFDRADVAARTGNPNPEVWTTGYQIGLSVGYPELQKLGQWKVYLNYKFLGADAVVDAFTDADFHLGGTNAKGWIFGADLALYKNMWLSARWLTADEISGPPLEIDVIQMDLNVRF